LHDRVYGYATQSPAEIVNLRATHAARGATTLGEGEYRPAPGNPEKASRNILVAGAATPMPVRVYDRARLPVGMVLRGPAIVEQADTTTLLEPGWRGTVAADGSLLLQPDDAS
jgi:N-methylhydantoinase A